MCYNYSKKMFNRNQRHDNWSSTVMRSNANLDFESKIDFDVDTFALKVPC